MVNLILKNIFITILVFFFLIMMSSCLSRKFMNRSVENSGTDKVYKIQINDGAEKLLPINISTVTWKTYKTQYFQFDYPDHYHVNDRGGDLNDFFFINKSNKEDQWDGSIQGRLGSTFGRMGVYYSSAEYKSFEDAIKEEALSCWSGDGADGSTHGLKVIKSKQIINRQNTIGYEMQVVIEDSHYTPERITTLPVYVFPIPSLQNDVLFINLMKSSETEQNINMLKNIADTVGFSKE